MSSRRSEARGQEHAGLSRAQTLDLCARLASYGEAGAAPGALLLQAGGEAVRTFPDDVDVLVAVGRMYLLGEVLREAEAVLRRALRRAPGEVQALRLLGEVMLRQGDPVAAHEALSKAVAAGMHDPWTKQWVARALDYSELAEDLGREGIARDVRQVLGKPGQGPPEEDRRRPPLRPVSPSRPPLRMKVLGKIDKGVFFPGDPRAELPELRSGALGVGPDEVVDLPTPAPAGEVQANVRPSRPGDARSSRPGDARSSRPGDARSSRPGDARSSRPGDARSSRPGAARPSRPREASPSGPLSDNSLLRALSEESAWGAPSDPMPASDTEISAWSPDMPIAMPRGRSAPPVVEIPSSGRARAPRSTDPPPPGGRSAERVAPLPPGLPRLSASDLFDEFTENRRPAAKLADVAAAARAATVRQSGPGDVQPSLARDTGSARKGPPPLPSDASDDAPPARRGPPPLPQVPPEDTLDVRPTRPHDADSGPRAPSHDGLIITVLDGDMEGPVTAPPSALVPLSEGGGDVPPASREAGPVTAPASALLPPEPPSLELPGVAQGDGGDARDVRRSRPGAEAGKAAAGASAAPARKPLSRVQMWAVRAAVFFTLGALLALGFEMYKRNRATKIRALTAQASIALHKGGPGGVSDAEAALAAARNVDPKSRLVASSTVRMLFFAVIDVDPGRAGALGAAMEEAAQRGVPSSQMAFAQIARAMASGDPASASEIIANYDEDPDRAADALYQLAAGAALEVSDLTGAIERYRAAAKANGDVLSTEIRLVRALAYSGGGAEARQRLSAAAQKWPDRPEIAALGALVAAADPRPGEAAPLPSNADPDLLPRPLRAFVRCVSKGDDERALAKAIAEAELAQTLVVCGDVALRAGHEAAGRDAAKRALEMAPGHAPAYALVGRVALASGRFEEARQAALRAPADVAAEILSFIAYEAGDLAAMTSAAGRRAEDPRTEPVAAGIARLAGKAPLPGPVIEALARSPKPWADLVAMDAALDAGDLAQAQAIAAAWHGAEKHPVRASRMARLLRYTGKNGAAQAAAASAAPTLAARIEAALAAAEMASARTAAIQALDAARTDEERWTAAFLLAREGRIVPAILKARALPIPPADAPLLLRTVAALAMSELRLVLPGHPTILSLQEWTRNPDVAHALGVAPSAPGSAAPAPGSPSGSAPAPAPRLTGKLPQPPASDDPY